MTGGAFRPPAAADASARERQASEPFAGAGHGLPRAVDVVIAAAVLLLLAPLLVAAILAIRIESRGPAIYRQRRVGLRGREFELLKLRTMSLGSDPVGVGTAVGAADPRVTRVGRVLRRTSLDELPNLVNVLRGEMAIVGPRPTIPAQIDFFHPHQHRRHAVRPGMTGWAQVNGRLGISWGERIELDNWYVDHRSLRLDLMILARTVRQLVTGEGLDPG
ncbi:MAG: sugar transferase [Solirubrobacterales bacterium]|nr:sugar transferase [Solirubrobacterales bacterium]